MDSRPNTIIPILNSSEVSRHFLVDEVYKLLEGKIITGQLPANYKLTEHDIANALRISRSPIREALLRLENAGLVIRNKSGKRIVQSYTEQDIVELYELWRMTESFAVGVACLNATNKDFENIRNMIGKMRKCLNDIEGYRKLNQEFHELLIRPCPNRKLGELHLGILKQINWLFNITLSHPIEPEMSFSRALRNS